MPTNAFPATVATDASNNHSNATNNHANNTRSNANANNEANSADAAVEAEVARGEGM